MKNKIDLWINALIGFGSYVGSIVRLFSLAPFMNSTVAAHLESEIFLQANRR